MAIDDKFEEKEQHPDGLDAIVKKESEGLQKRIGEKDEKSSGILKIGWDILKYSPVLAGMYLLGGALPFFSSFITSVGFWIGSHFDYKKKKQKYTWNRQKRELASGQIIGMTDWLFYSLPGAIVKSFPDYLLGGFKGSLIKWAVMETFVVPYLAIYHTFKYFRDKVGVWNTIKGFFNLKILKYFKNCYKEALKPSVLSDSWDVYKYLAPLHLFQQAVLKHPTLMMLQALFINNPIFRYLTRYKTKESPAKKSIDDRVDYGKPAYGA